MESCAWKPATAPSLFGPPCTVARAVRDGPGTPHADSAPPTARASPDDKSRQERVMRDPILERGEQPASRRVRPVYSCPSSGWRDPSSSRPGLPALRPVCASGSPWPDLLRLFGGSVVTDRFASARRRTRIPRHRAHEAVLVRRPGAPPVAAALLGHRRRPETLRWFNEGFVLERMAGPRHLRSGMGWWLMSATP